MQEVIAAAIFLVIYIVCMFVTDRAIDRYIPTLANSKLFLRIIGLTVAFVGIFFLMRWGVSPSGAFINQRWIFNPLRWIWWVLGAITLGISQGFIVDAQHVGKLEARRKVSEPVVQAPLRVED